MTAHQATIGGQPPAPPPPGPTRYAIGLDVGGTKIAAGVVALATGQVLFRRKTPTRPQRGGMAVLDDVAHIAAELAAEAGGAGLPIAGIGVGVAELVDLEGRVTSGQSIAWAGLPVQERLSQLAPAVVDSDVRTAALAEALYGAGRPYPSFVYVTVGTGISCCLVLDGRPLPGARGNALVMSSGPWTATCSRCGATSETVLEEFASGPALVARYNASGAGRAERGEEVLAAVEAGDPAAIEVVASAGEALGNSVGLVVNVLDPGAVIVGGGLGLAGGLYWSRFVASARRHVWAQATRDLPIEMAALGADAGLVGAAARAANIHAP